MVKNIALGFVLLLNTLLLQTAPDHALIEKALTVELLTAHTLPLSENVSNIRQQGFKKIIEEGDYEGALVIALEGLEKFPQEFLMQALFATMLGDYGETIPEEPFHTFLIEKSKKVFEKLREELEGQAPEVRFYFYNEYYYRLKAYKEQYENGLAQVAYYWQEENLKDRGFIGYYCQGVGATHYACDLLSSNKKEAIEYAQKALVAWAQYFSYDNQYYNAYVHYARALAILGYTDEAMKTLSYAASLIKQDLTFPEFKEVVDFIGTLKE